MTDSKKQRLVEHIKSIIESNNKVDDNENTTFLDIFNKSKDEYLSIDHFDKVKVELLPKFKDTAEEFLSIIEPLVDTTSDYYHVLANVIDVLCSVYEIRLDVVHIELQNYSNYVWGPIFWKFIHYAAILIESAYARDQINDILDFPTIVYNIDQILPCSICAQNYLQVKTTNKMIALAIKRMAFGKCTEGCSIFHNIITEHISQGHQNQEGEPITHYTLIDYVNEYNFLSYPKDPTNKTKSYIKMRVEYQPLLHRILVIMLILWKNTVGRQMIIGYEDANRLILSLYESNSSSSSSNDETIPRLELYVLTIEEFLSSFQKIDNEKYAIFEPQIQFVLENLAKLYPRYVESKLSSS